MRFIKIKIRLLVLFFFNKTTNFITNDLIDKIQKNKNNYEKLSYIAEEIRILRVLYPSEPELDRAEVIVKRLLVMGC